MVAKVPIGFHLFFLVELVGGWFIWKRRETVANLLDFNGVVFRDGHLSVEKQAFLGFPPRGGKPRSDSHSVAWMET